MEWDKVNGTDIFVLTGIKCIKNVDTCLIEPFSFISGNSIELQTLGSHREVVTNKQMLSTLYFKCLQLVLLVLKESLP